MDALETVTSELQCDVEILLNDSNAENLNRSAAAALRRLADQLDRPGLQNGFHPIRDNSGKAVGEVYLNYNSAVADDE